MHKDSKLDIYCLFNTDSDPSMKSMIDDCQAGVVCCDSASAMTAHQ